MEIVFILAGVALGFIIGMLFAKSRAQAKSEAETAKLVTLEKQAVALQKDMENAQAELEREKEQRREDRERAAADAEAHKERLEEQPAILKREFESLSLRLLEETGSKLQKSGRTQLEDMLQPLDKRLQEFQSKVEATNKEDIERTTQLKTQIEMLAELNRTITQETHNLTSALKGDNKIIGNYGEMILRRLLEASGLREGIGFTEQGKEMGLKNEAHRTQQPDFILHLPENRCLIVDAKMSLQSYETYVNAENDDARAAAESAFIGSVKKHIETLGAKAYQTLHGLEHSPDYVLLFMPIEHSFIAAIDPRHGLYEEGLKKHIILVSPTTLMAILKALESVWKQHDVGQNALKIADEAGKMYDKFVLFLESMNEVDTHISRTRKSYDEAIGRLSTGHGAVAGRFEKLKTLGAKAAKQIDKKLLPEE